MRARGLLTIRELAKRLGVCADTVARWRASGLLRAERANDKGEWLYQVPDNPLPAKWKHKPRLPQVVLETCQGGAV